MRFHATLIFLVILIAPHGDLFAQAATVAGVVSAGGGQALPGVTVTTTPESGGLSRHTKTSSDGTYRFEGLPDGTYCVQRDRRFGRRTIKNGSNAAKKPSPRTNRVTITRNSIAILPSPKV